MQLHALSISVGSNCLKTRNVLTHTFLITAFANRQKDLPSGHKKGIAFALNMACKNRAIKAGLLKSNHKEEVQQQEELEDCDEEEMQISNID